MADKYEAYLDGGGPPAADKYEAYLGPEKPPPKSEPIADIGRALKTGVQQLPGQLTGLADVVPALAFNARPFSKAADIAGEITGFTPGKWAKETKYSSGYEQSQGDIGAAWKPSDEVLADPNTSKMDYVRSLAQSAPDIALEYLKNPTYSAAQVANSIPSMLAGGVGSKALMVAGRAAGAGAGYLERAVGEKLAAPIAAGVGEGAQQTGQQMDQYEGEDQRKNALAALASGGIDAAIGAGAGRVANALGLETAGTALAKAGDGKVASGVSAAKRIAAGAVNEGLLQELPQSAQEQVWQNWSEGKALMEGVARQAVEGAIAGGVMGAGANVMGGKHQAADTPPPLEQPPAAAAPGQAPALPAPAPQLALLAPGDPIRAQKLPDAGPLTAAVNIGLENEAQAADAGAPPPQIQAPIPVADAKELTGSAALKARRESDLRQFADENQGPATLGQGVLDQGFDARELSLEEANALAREAPAAKAPARKTSIPSGDAQEIHVDTAEPSGAGLTPTVDLSGMTPRTPKAQPVQQMTDADVVKTYVEQRRTEGTLSGRRFAGDFDSGRITPADVLALVKPKIDATPDERIAAAAAQAQPQSVQAGDLVTADGFPYGTRSGALARATKDGGNVIEVPGGFAVRHKENTSVDQPSSGVAAGVVEGPRDGGPSAAVQSPGTVGSLPASPGGVQPSTGKPVADSATPAPVRVAAVTNGSLTESSTPKENANGNQESSTQGHPATEQAVAQDVRQTQPATGREGSSVDAQAQDRLKPKPLKERREAAKNAAAPAVQSPAQSGERATAAPVAEQLAAADTKSLKARRAAANGVSPAVAEAVHKDAGQSAEPVTPAVVAEAIKTAASNTNRKPSQMKAEALRLIDAAIEKAPSTSVLDSLIGVQKPITERGRSVIKGFRAFSDERTPGEGIAVEARESGDDRWTVTNVSYDGSGTGRKVNAKLGELKGAPAMARDQLRSLLERLREDGSLAEPDTVAIDVPGDGKFTVRNTKERLAEFRRKVEQSLGFKDRQPALESPRVNGYGSKQAPGAAFGVEGGSGSKLDAFNNMVNEGDIEAASDYAKAVGLDLDPKKVANATKVLKWREDRAETEEAETPEPESFIPAPDGSIDYGRLPELRSQINDATTHPAGPVRMEEGGEFGRAHIKSERLQALKDAGYESESALLDDVAKNYTHVYEQPNGRLLLVKRNGRAKFSVVELQPHGGYYGVTTMFLEDKTPSVKPYEDRGGRKLLWPLAEAAPSGTVAPFPATASNTGAETADARESEPTVAPTASARLTDAGEELIRNRRGKLKGLAWDDVSAMNDTLKKAQVVKANVWPRPDYAKMVEDGAPAWKAAALKAVYDKLAPAPVTRAAPTDADLKAYIETMHQIRDLLTAELDRVAALPDGKELWKTLKSANVFGKVFPIPADAKPVFGMPSPFDRGSEQGKENNRRALLIGGNGAVHALQFGYKMTSKVSDLLSDGFPAKQEAWQKSYEVRQTETRNSDVPEADRIGEPQQRFYVYEKGSRWRLAKGVQDGGYSTQEQAEAFARSLTAKVKKDVLPPSRGLDLADVKRTGPDWRDGKDVNAQDIIDRFGFRGVNLGEYVKAKQDIAQLHLNHIYDAFSDLADLLGVPPKAMSLNGTLGVAIGAQGSGKALAHFVPGVNEINITRDSGAGALAHEFGHAMDHYFATQHGRAVSMAKRPYLSAVVDNIREAGGVRPEVMDAMRSVMKALNSRQMTEAEARKYLVDQRELNQKRLDRWVKEFSGNKGADPAALAAVAVKLKRGDLGTVVDGDVESNLSEFMRAAGLKPGNAIAANAFTLAYRLRDLADEQRFLKKHMPQVDTDYAKASAAMDAKKSSGEGYWSTPWEKFARAFETFAMDALKTRERESLYLSGLVDSKSWNEWAAETGKTVPYPAGAERLDMQQAFQKLADTIQTPQDDVGNVSMFSRAASEIRSLVALARTSRNENETVTIGQASTEQVALLRANGINIDGSYQHTADLYAVRHALKKHGDEKAEVARGQLQITAAELAQIPQIVASPDAYILGATSKIGRDLIGYVKVLPDGTTLYIEEVRTGKSRLAMTSIRKYPAAKNASESLQTVLLNVRNDGGDARIVYPKPDGAQPLSRSSATPGIAHGDAQAVAAAVRAAFPKGPPIIVHESIADAPAKLQADIEAAGAQNDVEAAFHDGAIHVFPQHIASAERMAFVVGHHEIRHAGLRALLGKDLPATMEALWSNPKLREAAAEQVKAGKATTRVVAVEEALADMPVAELQALNGFDRVVAAIRQVLRRVVVSLRKAGLDTLANALEPKAWTDADVAALVQRAEDVSRSGGAGSSPGMVFSRSAMKDTGANIQRGRDAMNRALLEKADQHRAMFRNGLGWVDFVWGDIGIIKSSGKTKYAKGISHILEARQRNDGMTESDATKLLTDGIVNAIALGREVRRNEHLGSKTVVAESQGVQVVLTRRKGSNTWLLNGWELKDPNAIGTGSVAAEATAPAPTTAQHEGEGSGASVTRFARGPSVLQQRRAAGIAARILNAGGGPKIIGNTSRPYTPAQLAAMTNVGFQVQAPTLEERVKALWQDAGKKLAQGIADQFAPVKEISQEAYGLLRLAKGASGAFEAMLKGGKLKLTDNVYDFDDTQRGGVLDTLLKPLGGEHHDFFRWVAANRAERLAGEGKENLFSPEDIAALKTLADGTSNFDYTIQHGAQAGQTTRDRTLIYADALKTFNGFNKNVLDLVEKSGLIDGESRHLWEHEFYVPFYRVADEDGSIGGVNIKGGAVRQQAFKSLKGGKQALNADLLDNTLMNWAHLLDAAAKNRAAVATLAAAENMGSAVSAPESTAREMANSMGKKSNVVWVMDEGQKHFYVVEDPYLMTALTSLEYAGMRSPVMGALGAFKHALTLGVTASPFFKVRNLIRDSVQAVASAPLGYNVAGNLVQGWKETKHGTDAHFRLLAGGGAIHFGTMMEGSEAKRVQALVESGVEEGSILDSDHKIKAFYRRFVEPSITAYNELGNRGEEINRAALYKQLRAQGVSHAQASLQARDLMDFSMQGSFTTIRFLTQVVPFFNARIQGLYKLGRAAKEDPARFSAVIGAAALASIVLMAAYSDDDDWKKREDWDRNNYWWFKLGGTAFRIPKPFEVGAIATLAERGFEYAFDKEMTGARFRQNVLSLLGDNLSMNPIPQMVKPMLDVYANKDSFTGRPIETMGMDKLKSEYRFTERTSMTARGLSTASNAVTGLVGAESLSPVQVDALLRGYFGWLGSFVVGAGDILARPVTGQPERPDSDLFKAATGGIVSDTRDASSRYVSQMYTQAREIEQAYGTWKALIKEGKTADAAEFRAANADQLAKYQATEAVKKAEAVLNQRIRRIEQSDEDGAMKQERIRQLRDQQDKMSRRLAPA